MNDSKVTKDESARSPFAGCFILIAAVMVMIFLIGFSVLTLFRQFNEIAKFTDEKPAPIEITSLENREADLNALSERVESFRQQLDGDKETSLTLSADDLNLAIAAYEPFKELRGTFRVTSIDEKNINIAISFPLNGKPRLTRDEEKEKGVITSDSRYLNGTLFASPHLLKHEVVLSLDRIEVPGKKVAPEFTNQMSPYRLAERYLKHPLIGPAMAKLTRVELSGDKVVLTRKPGENPADLITNNEVDSATSRLFKTLGIAAACFLAFAGIIVLIGVRAKAQKERNP